MHFRKCVFAIAGAMIALSVAGATASRDLNPLMDYSACMARAAVRLDDGRPDYAPVARAIAAVCRGNYRTYTRYMARTRPAEPIPSERDLAISAVQYERKYGPAPLAGHHPRR